MKIKYTAEHKEEITAILLFPWETVGLKWPFNQYYTRGHLMPFSASMLSRRLFFPLCLNSLKTTTTTTTHKNLPFPWPKISITVFSSNLDEEFFFHQSRFSHSPGTAPEWHDQGTLAQERLRSAWWWPAGSGGLPAAAGHCGPSLPWRPCGPAHQGGEPGSLWRVRRKL